MLSDTSGTRLERVLLVLINANTNVTGMGKEVENLLTENKHLLETK